MLYRKEIDGLRAISVLAVMLFHANFPFFSGGFVGVDVFFVISGYLITQIIVTQIQNGTFSLVHFYDRRARRILPALFAMMLICLPLAWLVLINPADLKDFCKSVLAVSLSVSNILFWRESGYFDSSNALKPLLHTWSLAVEEQYYLFFPVYLLLVWRSGWKIAALLTVFLAICSLVFAQWGSTHQPVFNFYWLPARMWELLAGALIPITFAASGIKPPPRGLVNKPCAGVLYETLGALGLVMIFSSVFLMDEKMLWPSVWTLLPVLGTVLVLIFSSDATLTGRMLSARPLVGIGLISYSAYLWHQPLLAFSRYQFDSLSFISRSILVAGALVLGWLSWKFVEAPFRDKNRFTTRQVFISALICVVFFVAVGVTGYLRSGFLYRLSAKDEPVFAYVMKNFMTDIRPDLCFIQLHDASRTFSPECSVSATDQSSTLLWGDSHAAALYMGFKMKLGDVMQFTAGSCAPIFWNVNAHPNCLALNQYAMDEIKRIKPKTIYLQANWLEYPGDLDAAAQAIKKITEWVPGIRIILIGNVPNWTKVLPRNVLQSSLSYDQELYMPLPMLSVLKESDQRLEAFSKKQGIEFVSALDLLCRKQECLAVTMTQTGPRLTAFDYGHLTQAGSETLVKLLLAR